VGDEHGRVELLLSSDPRLVAGVARAVEYIAERAGFDARAQADLTAAAEEACRDTLPLLSEADPKLGVIIEGFADRIEVALEHGCRPAASAGQEGLAGTGMGVGGAQKDSLLLSRVDRVLHCTQSGTCRTTLVKYLRVQRHEK